MIRVAAVLLTVAGFMLSAVTLAAPGGGGQGGAGGAGIGGAAGGLGGTGGLGGGGSAGGLDPLADADGDGYTIAAGDCEDGDSSIHPGADELCNGLDDNCDERIDEISDVPLYLDADGDGYGAGALVWVSCEEAAAQHSTSNADCDDQNPNASPGRDEACDDGIDNDCDGFADEGCMPQHDSGDGNLIAHGVSALLLAGWLGLSAWRRRRRLGQP